MFLTNSIDIAASPQAVFDWLTDLGNLPRWQAGVFESEILTPPPVRVGTRFRETFRLFGLLRMTAECEVLEMKPPRSWSLSAIGAAMRYTTRIELAPIAVGTRLTHSSSATLRGLWRVLTPLVRAESERENRAELGRLKVAIEEDEATAPATAVPV